MGSKYRNPDPLIQFLAGFLICILIECVLAGMLYSENFTSDEPNSEEILKKPFYDRLSSKEDTTDPKIKKLCVKAAWIAAKDNGEMATKLNKILLHHVQEAIDISELDDKNTEIAKQAAAEGTKRALVEADSLITKRLLNQTPTPPPGGANYAENDEDF
tara:strand:- start:1490 stop:1966 length:477 start_codon:yes stop_codon:yes gene_type:complete